MEAGPCTAHHCAARELPIGATSAFAALRHAPRSGSSRRRRPMPRCMPRDAMCQVPRSDGWAAFMHIDGGMSGQCPSRRRACSPLLGRRFSGVTSATSREAEPSGGTYVDFGSISYEGDEFDYPPGNEPPQTVEQIIQSTNTTIEEWRSQHWIVLVDDEPSIRLAIGDYLHSMGYSTVTACDGPMAFLEVLLHSCSWSLLEQECPPWMEAGNEGSNNHQRWRLPNCVISDIRMPGGIDGVQLLELLRHVPDVVEHAEHDTGRTNPSTKKKGRPKKQIEADDSVYDEKDDFELLDAIVAGNAAAPNERIITPKDQAMQYLDAIRGCIDVLVHDEPVEGQEESNGQPHPYRQYPASMQQLPVILLTAKAMVSDRIVGYRAGANGYLPKPFRPEELLGMVDGLIRKQERDRVAWMNAPRSASTYDSTEGGMDDLTPEQAVDITRELMEIRMLLQERMKQQKTAKERLEREGLRSLLPKAIWMLRTGERRQRVFTKDHIRSILAFCYGVWLPKNNTRRSDAMKELERQMADHPEKLMDVVLSEQ